MSKYHLSSNTLEALNRQQLAHSISIPDQPQRTLLLIGPTRAGKSTIYNVLRDDLFQPEKPTMYSGTKLSISQTIGGLKIIDMPGFNDLSKNTGTSLTNQKIRKMLEQQLIHNDPVHTIAFVFNLACGIKQQDIDTMVLMKLYLASFTGRTILVITYAEEANDEDKNRLKKEFYDHPDVKKHDLRNFFSNTILFLGCLRYESIQQDNKEALTKEHQNIIKMRKIFINKCFEEIPSNANKISNNNSRLQQYIIYPIIILAICFALMLQWYLVNRTSDNSIETSASSSDLVNDNNFQHDSNPDQNDSKFQHDSNPDQNDSKFQHDSNLDQNDVSLEEISRPLESNINLENIHNDDNKEEPNLDESHRSTVNTAVHVHVESGSGLLTEKDKMFLSYAEENIKLMRALLTKVDTLEVRLDNIERKMKEIDHKKSI